MAQPRPFKIEYFKRRRIVKVGHASTLNGALRAMVRSIHGDKVAAFAQVINGHGVVKATLHRNNFQRYVIWAKRN